MAAEEGMAAEVATVAAVMEARECRMAVVISPEVRCPMEVGISPIVVSAAMVIFTTATTITRFSASALDTIRGDTAAIIIPTEVTHIMMIIPTIMETLTFTILVPKRTIPLPPTITTPHHLRRRPTNPRRMR